MQFLVICRPTAGGDQDEFKRLVPAEARALREHRAAGALTGAWNPGGPGAVLMLDVPGQAEAARIVAAFPLVQAGLITTEVSRCTPLTWPDRGKAMPGRAQAPTPL